MKLRPLPVLLLISLLLVSSCAAPAPTPGADISVDRPSFGEFSAPDLDGEEYTQELFSNADLTMVNIWGTSCGPCIREMPFLGELSEEYADKGFQIVGIVVDAASRLGGYDKGIVSTAEDIVAQTGADYTHLLPSEDLINIRLSNVRFIPETVFVDKNGGIVGKAITGGNDKEGWKKTIDAHLALVR